MKKKATREQTRAQNRQLVLKTIYDQGKISRAQIARLTRLARPTVSDVVAELIEQGLVVELGYAPSTGGKRPMLLKVDADALHMIAVDLSRSDFRGVVMDLRGEVKHRERRPWRRGAQRSALELVYDVLDALVAATDRPLLGISLGAPGLIDAVDGVVVQAVNMDWSDLPIRRLLEARYGVPVYVANDCQVAALGEYTFGNADQVRDLVVISGGWGIGCGMVLDGRLHHGNPMGAGEIGHVRVAENGRRCSCGNTGCLETVAGTYGIVEQVRALKNEREGLDLTEIGFDAVLEMYEAGDEAVREVVLAAGRGLGVVASHLAVILGGCDIRLAGQLAALGPAVLDAMREEISSRALTELSRRTRVASATLGDDIVLLGASALLLRHELGVL